jgi:protein ImuB
MYGCLHSPSALPSEEALLGLAREFTPRVEASAPTPVLLDLQGLGRLWPDLEILGRTLLETAHARHITLQVALAATRTTARVVALGQPGLTIVPPGREAETLAPLPLHALGLPPEQLQLFHRWGLTTLGEIARLPADQLAARLGAHGPRLLRLARGEDEIPFVPAVAGQTFTADLDLDWPVEGLEPLCFLLARVLDPLCASLVARGRRAAAVELTLGLVDGREHRRALRPAAPSAEPRTWRTLLRLDLEGHPPADAVRRLRVRAEPTPARPVQFSLLDPAQPSPEKLAETIARLGGWARDGRGGAPLLLDTHRPGAFLLGSFAPGPAHAPAPGAVPARHRLTIRAFRPPLLAEVTLRDGVPAFLAAAGVRGAVLDRAGPWRASGDWWDVAWSREEWDVSLGQAGCYRIFLDRLRQAWFVEGEID